MNNKSNMLMQIEAQISLCGLNIDEVAEYTKKAIQCKFLLTTSINGLSGIIQGGSFGRITILISFLMTGFFLLRYRV